jgi:hypothetical protein
MFNINSETLGIWAVTVMFICITYAGFKSVIQLFLDGHLRLGALLPVIANVHGDHILSSNIAIAIHVLRSAFVCCWFNSRAGVYYHWFVSFTYMNESWYHYWYSQWVFGISEFVVMYILFLRLDSRFQLKCEHAGAVFDPILPNDSHASLSSA